MNTPNVLSDDYYKEYSWWEECLPSDLFAPPEAMAALDDDAIELTEADIIEELPSWASPGLLVALDEYEAPKPDQTQPIGAGPLLANLLQSAAADPETWSPLLLVSVRDLCETVLDTCNTLLEMRQS